MLGNSYHGYLVKPSSDWHLSWRDSTIPVEGNIRRGNNIGGGFECDSMLSTTYSTNGRTAHSFRYSLPKRGRISYQISSTTCNGM